MKDCLYQKIYEETADDIRTGKIKAGSRLPSIRKYSEEKGISCNTVQAAYTQLMEEGYIFSREKKGYFASELEFPVRQNGDFHSQMPAGKKENEIFGENACPGENGSTMKTGTTMENAFTGDNAFSRAQMEEADGEAFQTDSQLSQEQFQLYANLTDSSFFPFSTIRHLYREVLNKDNQFLFQTGDFCGDIEFRKAIADFVYSHRRISCSYSQIVIGSGTEYLIQQIVKMFSAKEKVTFIAEDPGYEKTARIAGDAGTRIISIPVNSEGIDIEKIREKNISSTTILHITPSHQFPLGITMPASRRSSIFKWVYEKDNRYIIEDDYDGDFRYKGHLIPSMAEMNKSDRVIYMGTFSRTLTPALRISYAILPLPLIKIYREKFQYYSCSVSRIDQQMLSIFIKDGYFERHLYRAKKIYREKRDYILKMLKTEIPGVRIYGEEAGLHFIIQFDFAGPENCLSVEKQSLLEAEKQGLFLRGTGTGWLIIGYAHLDHSQMEKAVLILKRIYQNIKNEI